MSNLIVALGRIQGTEVSVSPHKILLTDVDYLNNLCECNVLSLIDKPLDCNYWTLSWDCASYQLLLTDVCM